MISSEEAIAKGIRRIVALTGPEAENAHQRANRFEDRLNKLLERVKQNPDIARDQHKFKELMKEINDMNSEFAPMVLPHWRKDSMRNIVKEAQKLLDQFDKKIKAEIAEKVLQQAKQLSKTTEASVLVHIFEKGANAKVTLKLIS